MSRFNRKSSKKAGSSPGTLVHVGERKTDDVHLALLQYNAETVIEKPFEDVGDVFTPVRERIRKGKGRIRAGGCDYLAYALLDAIVDNYFVILEKVGQRLETLEETIDENPDAGMLDLYLAIIAGMLVFFRRKKWL